MLAVAQYATKLPTHDVLCLDSDEEDMACDMMTTDEPICIDVDTSQKISSEVKSEDIDDTDEIPEIK